MSLNDPIHLDSRTTVSRLQYHTKKRRRGARGSWERATFAPGSAVLARTKHHSCRRQCWLPESTEPCSCTQPRLIQLLTHQVGVCHDHGQAPRGACLHHGPHLLQAPVSRRRPARLAHRLGAVRKDEVRFTGAVRHLQARCSPLFRLNAESQAESCMNEELNLP
jgi:hypothetical protein